jgi:hypothetical protein
VVARRQRGGGRVACDDAKPIRRVLSKKPVQQRFAARAGLDGDVRDIKEARKLTRQG